MSAVARYTCPSCNHAAEIPAKHAGKKIRCQACRAVVEVALEVGPPGALQEIESAGVTEPVERSGCPQCGAQVSVFFRSIGSGLCQECEQKNAERFERKALEPEDENRYSAKEEIDSIVEALVKPHPSTDQTRDEYRTIQFPPTLEVAQFVDGVKPAALLIQRLANRMAEKGWAFERVDTLGVQERPGCLGLILSLFGLWRQERYHYYVLTFRRREDSKKL